MKKLTDRDIDNYRVLTKCLVECTSIEHLKVLLDLHGMKYSRDSELEFLKWLHSLSFSWLTPKRCKGIASRELSRAKEDRYMRLEVKSDPHKKRSKQSILMKMIIKHAKKHIDELEPDLAIKWLRASLQDKKRGLSGFKSMLLSIWMDKHGSELCLKTRS